MKVIFILLMLISLGILITGCSSVESEMQEVVRGNLKDPDSAKFGKFTMIDDDRFCLTVNARNSMGGFTGDQEALGINFGNQKLGDVWLVTFMKTGHASCVSVQKQLIKK
jgi:hypothetical protein